MPKASSWSKRLRDIGLLRLGPGFDRLRRVRSSHSGPVNISICSSSAPRTSRIGRPMRMRAVDVARRHAAARFEPGIERRAAPPPPVRARPCRRSPPAGCPAAGLHPYLVFDLREVAVKFAAEVDQQPVVRKFEERFHDILGAGGGVSALMPKGVSFMSGATGKVLQPATSSGKRNSCQHKLLCENACRFVTAQARVPKKRAPAWPEPQFLPMRRQVSWRPDVPRPDPRPRSAMPASAVS